MTVWGIESWSVTSSTRSTRITSFTFFRTSLTFSIIWNIKVTWWTVTVWSINSDIFTDFTGSGFVFTSFTFVVTVFTFIFTLVIVREGFFWTDTFWSINSWPDTINTIVRGGNTGQTLWFTLFTEISFIIIISIHTDTVSVIIRHSVMFWVTSSTSVFVTFLTFSWALFTRSIISWSSTWWTGTGWGVDSDTSTASTMVNSFNTTTTLWFTSFTIDFSIEVTWWTVTNWWS
jgi:hypothetical protein